MTETSEVDRKYYQVAGPGSLAERLVVLARDSIYSDFISKTQPRSDSTILDVGVSDVVGEAANVLERKYPHLNQITAVGLGVATAFCAAFPNVTYRQINPGEKLPFADRSFDIATSNAVMEHVGGLEGQLALTRELVRVAKCVFITVPHRMFFVEHHTAIPLMHWWDPTFRLACAALGKREWTDPANLTLMTRSRLDRLRPSDRASEIGFTGIRLGPFSSNLFLFVRAPSDAA